MQHTPTTSLADELASRLGADGDIAARTVGAFYRELDDADVPTSWATLFGFDDRPLSTRQQSRLSGLLEEIDEPPSGARFFFSLHSFLALALRLTLRRAAIHHVDAPSDAVTRDVLQQVVSGAWFRDWLGVTNMGGDDPFGWFMPACSDALLAAAVSVDDAIADIDRDAFRAATGQAHDIFSSLYEALIPRTVRRTLGEHYTPRWLAEYLVGELESRLDEMPRRSLDPSCGSGVFLLEVLRRCRVEAPSAAADALLERITGYDLNPLAVLAARANLLLATLDRVADDEAAIELPVHGCDALETQPPDVPFDAIVGNPPWINWQGLDAETRERLQPLWERYGLFVHEGFDTILGKGKKEFATLFTAAVVDRFLADGGRLAFVITQGVWKAAGASEGFRRLDFGGEFELSVEHIEDLSSFKAFDSATTRTTIFIATKGARVAFPVDYVYWRRRGRRASLDSRGTIADALEHAERIDLAAEPYDADAPESPWITARPAAIRALRRLFGGSSYQARQGVNTGGGNAVYWLRVLQRTTLGGVRVENILKGAKKKVERVRAEIEADFVYPLVRGRDVSRWWASGDRQILMVQDPEHRRGIDEETLETTAPRTLAYLEGFEAFLRGRSLFRRYFTRGGEPVAPWWSMFGVGEYTMAPWKVVWAGQVATHLDCAVVGSTDGRLVLPDQTAYYVGVTTEEQADFLCGLLNSAPVRLLYRSFLYKHVSLSFIEVLDLPPFDPEQPWMVELADAAHRARVAAQRDDAPAVEAAASRVDDLACDYWNIGTEERAEVARSLERLR